MILIFNVSQGKNKELSSQLARELDQQGKQYKLIDLINLNLPLYCSENEEELSSKFDLSVLLSQMKTSKTQVYLAPEYNGSMPPVLNNFIAWVSRSSSDWRECFNEKKCLIGTHSGGGGAHVLMAMRQQFSYIGMNVLGRQVLTNYNKDLNQETLESVCRQL